MYNQNLRVLKDLFNWYDISEISKKTVRIMSKKLGNALNSEIKIDSTWGYYKKFEILNVQGKDPHPEFFLKYVREYFFSELLGFHLTYEYLDSELCAKGYLAGMFHKKSFFRTEKIPYLFLRYVRGKSIENYDITEYKYQLGRLSYLHEVLSLYDVYDRHFIVQPDNTLCRIDFGRSFENLQKKYLGFKDFLDSHDINEFDGMYLKGYKKEKEIIKKNLESKKNKLARFIRMIKVLKQDHKVVFFNIDRFVNRLIDHWSKIGFLNEMDMTYIEWI